MQVINKINWAKLAVVLLSACLLGIIVYKAVHLPITHDEVSASLGYATWKTWDILMSDVWPSNHILNTLLVKFLQSIFGIKAWSARLPNVFSFVLIVTVLYLTAQKYFSKSQLLFCLPFAALLANPYFLDFFGLARGYGMSNALMACSVYCLLAYAAVLKTRWYYGAIILAMLAAYANFTLLIFWVAIHLLIVVLLLVSAVAERREVKEVLKQLLITGLLAGVFIAICFVPLYKMNSTNQFVYWSKEGFYKNTILSEAINFLYGIQYSYMPASTLAKLALWVFFLVMGYTLLQLLLNVRRALANPLVVIWLLITLVWGVNMVQAILLGTPFLEGRTALSYYVLFVFLLIFSVRQLALHFRFIGLTLSFVIIVLGMYHLHRSVTLNQVREWWYDANTYRVEEYLHSYKAKHPELATIDLNTNWIYYPSFSYDIAIGKTPWINLSPYHKETDTGSQTLFYYAIQDETSQIEGYTQVLTFAEGGALLIKAR